MNLPEVLGNLRKRPAMYLTSVAFDVAVAFVQGYDAATSGGLLMGFREWLIVALGDGNNLAWPELVRMLAERNAEVLVDEKALIDFMFLTLDRFLFEREQRGGMRRIYASYDSWLRQQEWYSPSSPDWISLE